nr:type II toxin-antitoxin system HicB family antitoxin [Methanoculleus marisnigri]
MIGLAKLRLTILIWEEEGAYVSRCQELEVASCGDTPEEALDNIREAIELYLENARELGILQDIEPILISRHKFTSVIEVEA